MPEVKFKQPLPWHSAAWNQIRHAAECGRLPHALLLTGPAGIGKRLFAEQLCHLMLCEAPNWQTLSSCASCASCQKAANHAHPDFRILSPQEGKREILIDDVRNLLNFMQLSAQVNNGYKVVLICPADRMNNNAANALLKTLEEPPQNRIIILVAESLGKIPATIRSRCQKLLFSIPTQEVTQKWLHEVSAGEFDASTLSQELQAPLSALESWQNRDSEEGASLELWQSQWSAVMNARKSPLEIAQSWAEQDSQYALCHWLQRELLAAFRAFLNNCDNEQAQTSVCMLRTTGFTLQDCLIIQSKINMILESLETNVNIRLTWEAFLLECRQMAAIKKAA